MSRIIGNGENTSFWCDPWLEGGCLRSRLSLMFNLYVASNVTFAETRRQS